jgi:hypothetical protein
LAGCRVAWVQSFDRKSVQIPRMRHVGVLALSGVLSSSSGNIEHVYLLVKKTLRVEIYIFMK